MDKTMMNTADGKTAHTGTNPNTMDVHEMKSVLGQYLHDSDFPEEEKQILRERLHAATTHEALVDLWRDITGQQI